MVSYQVGVTRNGKFNAVIHRYFYSLQDARKNAYEWLGWSHDSLEIVDGQYQDFVGRVFLHRIPSGKKKDDIIRVWTSEIKEYRRLYSDGRLGDKIKNIH